MRGDENEKGQGVGQKKSYRLPSYGAALRMARLVDEMPRHSIGVRVAGMAEQLGVSPQSIRRYVKAMEDHFLTEEGKAEFVIERVNDEEWLKRKPKSAGLFRREHLPSYLGVSLAGNFQDAGG